MAEATFAQTSFRGGEWSKSHQGRFDLPEYRTALSVCKNAMPTETEAWTRRPGFLHAGYTAGGNAARLFDYTFNDAFPYKIEASDIGFRFFSGTSLATTNDARTVVSISSANPAIVTVDAAHGWSDNDSIFFTFRDPTSPALHNRPFSLVATSYGSTQFALVDGLTGQNIDGSTLAWATPTKPVTVQRVAVLLAGYAGLWQDIRVVNSNTEAIVLHGAVAPNIIRVATDAAAGTFATFTIDNAFLIDGPYLDPSTTGVTVTPNSTTGLVTFTLNAPAWVSTKAYTINEYVTVSTITYRSLVDQNVGNTPATSPTDWEVVDISTSLNQNGFSDADFGRLVRLFSQPPDWATGTNYVANNVVTYNNSYWIALTAMTGTTPGSGSKNPNTPGVDATKWAPISGSGVALWTWGKIVGFANNIPQSTGSVLAGDMTNSAASFDGVNAQSYVNCSIVNNSSGGVAQVVAMVGKNYSGSGAEAISSVTIFPSTDRGVGYANGKNIFYYARLMASHTVPNLTDKVNGSTGTVLGTTSASKFFKANTTSPISITSSDTTTAWEYVWVELTVANDGLVINTTAYIGEVVFFTNTANNNALQVEILGNDLLYTSPIEVWRMGLYGGPNGYPKVGTYHEGRLWLSGAIPNRVDACKANGINGLEIDFSPTEVDGTVTDASAISYIFNAPDKGDIEWMLPDQQGIIAGTLAGEWLIQASNNNNILTPTSIQAHRVTTIGCANILPIRTPLTTVFVQKHKRKLQEYFADVFSGKFTSPNLAKAARHLTDSGIEELSYQQEPTPMILARRADGVLVGTSYLRERLFSADAPNINGWHQHPRTDGRLVEYIMSGGNADGTTEQVSIVTNDPVTGLRHVEIMAPFMEEDGGLTDAQFLDNGIIPDAQAVATVNGVNSLVLYGIYPHAGKTVTVWGGGRDLGDFTVASDGTVTIPFSASFSVDFYAEFQGNMPCLVGFSYDSDGQLLPPMSPVESGSRNGPGFAKSQRSHYIMAQLVNTKGISFGTDFNKLKPAKLIVDGSQIGTDTLFTGTHRDSYDSADEFGSKPTWRVSRPYPATITAIGAAVNTKDV